MKLSKESLNEILFEASMSIHDDAYKAGIALENDTLEIEGYERFEWIKFDPNNPNTFPPKTDEYIVAIEGRSTSTTRKYSAEYLEFFAPEKITHWRPLPKPPGKEEL